MNNTVDLEELVPWQRGPTERGGYSIVFACLAVVVTSTWTALHLNLPGLDHAGRRRTEAVVLLVKLRRLTIFPAINWTTFHKIKWTSVMVVFPEFVFAHAVLELRMALDDYIKMDEEHAAMHKKNWCIEARSWTFVMHDLLQGRWPAVKISFSTEWPWFKIASRRNREVHEWIDGRPKKQGDEEAVQTDAGDKLQPATAAQPTWPNSPKPTAQAAGVSATETSEVDIAAEIPSNDALERNTQEIDAACPAHSLPDDFWPDHHGEDYSAAHPMMCREMKLPKWTLTHVYFANMGGIKLNQSTVPADYLAKTLSMPSDTLSSDGREAGTMTVIAEARLSEAQIKDKGKADLLLRLLWIWQILRLWAELSTRAALRLPVTQLEIITLSFSVISILIHVIQWPKPKDVEEPINFKHAKVGYVKALTTVESLASAYLSYALPKSHPERLLRTHIPNDTFREEHQSLFLAMLTTSTILFGLIHCGAWNFNFPTSVERWIWRGCALSGIVLPLIMVLLTYLFNRSLRSLDKALNAAEKNLRASVRRLGSASGKDFQWSTATHYYGQQFASGLAKDIKSSLQSQASPADVSAEIKDLDEKAAEVEESYHKRRYLMSQRRFYQLPAIFVYLLTRIAIITLAFMSFRKAPRGIYKDTWAAFIPTFQ